MPFNSVCAKYYHFLPIINIKTLSSVFYILFILTLKSGPSQPGPDTFQVPNSHTWQVDLALDSAGFDSKRRSKGI